MTSTSDEGTGFYYCAKCEKPCDQVVEGNDMIKHLMEVAGIKAGIEMQATEIASEKIEARLEKQKQAFLDIIGDDEEVDEYHDADDYEAFRAEGRNKLRAEYRAKVNEL